MAYFPSVNNCQQLTIDSDTQLDYPYSVTSGNAEVTDIIDITVTTSDIKVFLPDASETTPGFSVTFNNIGTNDFNVVLYDKETFLNTVAVGEFKTFYVYDVSTSNGSWRVIKAGDGQSGISNLSVISSDTSVNITGSPVTNPGGEIDLSLDNLIAKIKTLSNTEPGILLFNRDNEDIWSSGSIVGDNNITVENYDGSAGSLIIVKLDSNVALTEITTGNVRINGNTITNTNYNNNLVISSSGTDSKLNLNGILIDKDKNLTNINSITITDSLVSKNTLKAACRIRNTSGVVYATSKYNVSYIEHKNNSYIINFSEALYSTEYVVNITCSNTNSTPPLQTRIGYDIARTMLSVTIVITDLSGEIVTDFPEGVSVTIFSVE